MAAWREKLGVLGERVADTMTRLQLVDSCTLNLFVALPRSSLSLRGQGHVSCAALWRSAPLWSAGLTSIDLRHTRVDDKFIARLGASEAAETIECLNLSQSQYITDAAIAHLRAFPRLRWLALKGCNRVTPDAADALTRNCPSLQELDVSQNKMVTDAFFTGLLRRDVDGRQGLPALVSLRLVGTEVTSIGCLRFIRERDGTEKLTTFTVPYRWYSTGATNDWLEVLEECWRRCPRLTRPPFPRIRCRSLLRIMDACAGAGLGHAPPELRELSLGLLADPCAETGHGHEAATAIAACRAQLVRLDLCSFHGRDLAATPELDRAIASLGDRLLALRLAHFDAAASRWSLPSMSGRLETLTLDRIRCPFVGLTTALSGLGHHLRHLFLESCTFTTTSTTEELTSADDDDVSRDWGAMVAALGRLERLCWCASAFSPPRALRVAIAHPRLERLELGGSDPEDGPALELERLACPQLRRVVLDLERLRWVGQHTLAAALREQSPALEEIDIDDGGVMRCPSRPFARLHTLTLRRAIPVASGDDDDDAAVQVTGLAAGESLTRLSLARYGLARAGELDGLLRHFPRLTRLELDSVPLPALAFDALQQHEALSELSLSNIECEPFAMSCAGFPNLTALQLNGKFITALRLNNHPTLARVVVANSSRLVALSALGCPSLYHLHIESSGGAADGDRLALAIDCPSLLRLSLYGVRSRSVDVAPLRCPKLRHLVLDRVDHLPLSVVEQVFAECPDLATAKLTSCGVEREDVERLCQPRRSGEELQVAWGQDGEVFEWP